jgi:hypothetical protein
MIIIDMKIKKELMIIEEILIILESRGDKNMEIINLLLLNIY